MLALYAAALDTHVSAAGVSGYFGRREGLWHEPIERTAFGLLNRFGDAEMAGLVYPRGLVIEAAAGPHVIVRSKGAASSELSDPRDPTDEFARWSKTIPT